MPWPDFTELSFGYCFLRELETKYTPGGRFPKAPDFISQHAEKTKGYDVEVDLAMNGSAPVFIQLKRSMVMIRNNAIEYGSPYFANKPVFRMKLHKNDGFAQHKALMTLEQAGNNVVYATSQVATPEDLIEHTRNGTIVTKASSIFSPSSIKLPDFQDEHHVSFYADQTWAVLFSEEGKQFQRKWSNSSEWIANLASSARDLESNEKAMREAEGVLRRLADEVDWDLRGPLNSVLERFSRPTARVAVLAYYLLGVQLMFLKAPKDGA